VSIVSCCSSASSVSANKGVRAGLDLDGAVAAGGADKLFDGPAGDVFDQVGHGQGGEHGG
jgi:hypothetical protein